LRVIEEDFEKGLMSVRAYLAGPDVFLREAGTLTSAKRELCRQYGLIGVSPVDNIVDFSGLSKTEAALRIALTNERLIRDCDLVIANVTPFRGPSADVGTVYEMGYARGLGRAVFAYTNDGGNLLARMREDTNFKLTEDGSGRYEDEHQMHIEDFDCFDNLMLLGSVYDGNNFRIVTKSVPKERYYTDLEGFEGCLRLAAEAFALPGARAV
jgi:nucleoside 2-deoxyribosyltransferase